MKICTWNSQGNPLNDAIKLNILNHLLTIKQCNVVMIQECGQFILPAQRGYVKTPNINNKKLVVRSYVDVQRVFVFLRKRAL